MTGRDGFPEDWLIGCPVADTGRHVAAGCVTVTVRKHRHLRANAEVQFQVQELSLGQARILVTRPTVQKMESFVVLLSSLRC